MLKQITLLEVRHDAAGSGEYGAPRGKRTHVGVDYHCQPGMEVLSPVRGKFTKYGYCYGDDLQWRYVQITDEGGNHHRLFYTEEILPMGALVEKGQPVALAQDISKRYPGRGMLPHVHYEIMNCKGEHINPENFVAPGQTQ